MKLEGWFTDPDTYERVEFSIGEPELWRKPVPQPVRYYTEEWQREPRSNTWRFDAPWDPVTGALDTEAPLLAEDFHRMRVVVGGVTHDVFLPAGVENPQRHVAEQIAQQFRRYVIAKQKARR